MLPRPSAVLRFTQVIPGSVIGVGEGVGVLLAVGVLVGVLVTVGVEVLVAVAVGVAVGAIAVIVNDWLMDGAAAHSVVPSSPPACEATMVHVPLETMVTRPAGVTVHRAGVLDANVMDNPDDADAFEAILNGAVPTPPKKLAVTPLNVNEIV